MLKQRVLTAFIGIAVIAGMAALGPLSWKIFVYLGSLVGVSEFVTMSGFRWFSFLAWWAYAIVTVMLWRTGWASPIGVYVIAVSALVIPVLVRNHVSFRETGAILVGTLYLGVGAVSLSNLRQVGDGWTWLVVYVLTIWATDTAAYFGGRWLHGPKLWPTISPNKTISGALIGLIGGTAVTLVIGGLLLEHFGHWPQLLWLGLMTSFAGQVGDLVESAYKRATGTKDSGKLLPGHGGILDRVDSLLFAAPFALYLIESLHP
ncbi:phosphatidate cytidylyltransferase [Alicyclobacillaceae bacterium I2511]|jgi:phosphatidate cytidylyltransferase|nr:phosphatidate cytidylyltransferase [Alicyclobacillaceae bacterium I2511]